MCVCLWRGSSSEKCYLTSSIDCRLSESKTFKTANACLQAALLAIMYIIYIFDIILNAVPDGAVATRRPVVPVHTPSQHLLMLRAGLDQI